jgi:RNA polymerase sigma-70 factor (ECF subfamily)
MTRPPRDDSPGERIGRLYDRFAAPLYRYAVVILADRAAAADAVQQVFVTLLRGRGAERRSDAMYLRRAVRNECYSMLRRRRRDLLSPADSPILEAVAAEDDRPDERLAIEQAMRTLPPEQREVVYLKAFEGMTLREIADSTGESIDTVASRHRYAMEKLRVRLSAIE